MSSNPTLITVNPSEFSEFLRSLGEQLLSYVLNLSKFEIETLLKEGGSITFEQSLGLEELKNFAHQIISNRTNNQTLEDRDLMNMVYNLDRDGRHIFSKIRQISTQKSFAHKEYSDPVMQAFSKICVECFPVLMLPEKQDSFGGATNVPYFFSLPIAKELCEAFLNDPEISEIFPDKKDYSQNSYQICTSRGQGRSIQACMFYTLLIKSSFSLMKTQNEFSLDSLLDCAEKNLEMIRDLIRGNTIKVPIILCFRGAWLPAGTNKTVLNGTITNLNEDIKNLFPPHALPGQFNDKLDAGFVYIAEAEYQIKVMKNWGVNTVGKWPDNLLSPYNKIIEIADEISFACCMAVNREEPVSIEHISTFVFDPLGFGSEVSMRFNLNSNFNPIGITEKEGTDLITWSSRISKAPDTNIALAKRRLQLALSERVNPEDGLIDCIIALENLFGDRSEIAFSIATAVSKLLETDFKEREIVFSHIKKLYNSRSAIIHGTGQQLDKSELVKHRNQLTKYLIKCFKKLYLKQDGLLELDSKGRTKKLVLS